MEGRLDAPAQPPEQTGQQLEFRIHGATDIKIDAGQSARAMAGGVPLEVGNQRVPQRAQGGAAVTGVGRWQMEGNLSVQHRTASGTGDEEFLQDPRRFCAPIPRGIGHAPCRLIGFRSGTMLSGVAENAAPVELLEELVEPLPIGRVHGAFLPVVAHQDDPARDNKFKGIESVKHIIGQHRSVGQPAAEQVNPRTVVKLESEVCHVPGDGQLSRPVCRGRGRCVEPWTNSAWPAAG